MNGQVVEAGSYSELMRNNGPFGRLLLEFGGADEQNKEESDATEEEAVEEASKQDITKQDIIRLTKKHMGKAAGTGKLEVGCNRLLTEYPGAYKSRAASWSRKHGRLAQWAERVSRA